MLLAKFRYFVGICVLVLIAATPADAQKGHKKNGGSVVLQGVVINKNTKEPIVAALVNVVQYGLWNVTCKEGKFCFKNVPADRIDLIVQVLGYKTRQISLDIKENQAYDLKLELEESTFGIKEVTVVAKESRTGSSTSSSIEKSVLEHIQPTNLGDVMQLLPGQLANNPDLHKNAQISLRQAVSTENNAFGSSIIMNGAPMSNNGNLQSSNQGGIDLRQISTDNIESIEIIRGIPSAEYGDLTSGAVIISTKAGKTPLEVLARFNPNTVQSSINKGFDLKKDRGFLNLDGGYTQSYADERTVSGSYERINGQLTYSKNNLLKGILNLNLTADYYSSKDISKPDPDAIKAMTKESMKDQGGRFAISSRFNINKEWARTVKFDASFSYAHQQDYLREFRTPSPYGLVNTARTDTLVQNYFTPGTYWSEKTVDGKPINFFVKISDSFYKKIAGGTHRFLIGAEYKIDGNIGQGYIFDEKLPPELSVNMARPRPFKEIPLLNQFSSYLQDELYYNFKKFTYKAQAGARFDMIQPDTKHQKQMISPRFNLSACYNKTLTARFGYGVNYKAPSLRYLYPDNAYVDLQSANYYNPQTGGKYAFTTTRVFNVENTDLKPSKNRKIEVGLDYRIKKMTFGVTLFNEKLTNGFLMTDYYVPINYQKSGVIFVNGDPKFDYATAKNEVYVARLNKPSNNAIENSKGVEFDFNFGRIDAIRTSVILNGGYTKTTNSTKELDYFMYTYKLPTRPTTVGIYPEGSDEKNYSRFTTALRLVHNIPELRFVISFTAQTIWSEKSWYTTDKVRKYPIGYMGSDGSITMLTPEEAKLPQYDYMVLIVNDSKYKTISYSPLWLYNIRITKEMKNGINFSFYANNFLFHQPIQKSSIGNYTMRNPALYFGTELSIKLY
jgi:hypothetical protein